MSRLDLEKYVHIRHLGDSETDGILRGEMVEVSEKIDGANFRFKTHEGRLIFGSRERFLGPHDDGTMTNNWNQFEAIIEYVKTIIRPEMLNPSFIYFSEDMIHPHTVSYKSAPKLAGFDIMALPPDGSVAEQKGGAAFLSTSAKEREFTRIGLPFIKPWGVFRNPTLDDIKPFLNRSSYETAMPEGVVIKNYERLNRWGRPLFAKIVNENFKEVNRAVWNSIKRDQNVEREIVEMFATEARIKKWAQKLTEDPGLSGKNIVYPSISMVMMPDLFVLVTDDILQEQILTIAKQWPAVNFSDLQKLVAKKTAQTLPKIMRGEI